MFVNAFTVSGVSPLDRAASGGACATTRCGDSRPCGQISQSKALFANPTRTYTLGGCYQAWDGAIIMNCDWQRRWWHNLFRGSARRRLRDITTLHNSRRDQHAQTAPSIHQALPACFSQMSHRKTENARTSRVQGWLQVLPWGVVCSQAILLLQQRHVDVCDQLCDDLSGIIDHYGGDGRRFLDVPKHDCFRVRRQKNRQRTEC